MNLIKRDLPPPPKNPYALAVQWDKAEDQRIEDLRPLELFGTKFSALRQKFLPRIAAARMSTVHTEVGGDSLDSAGDLATQLLFFDTIIEEVCPQCLTPAQLPSLELLLDRRLAIPRLVLPFKYFQKPVVDFLIRHQEEVISSEAGAAYRTIASCDSIEERHRRHHDTQPPLLQAFEEVPLTYKSAIASIAGFIDAIPSEYGVALAKRVEAAARAKDYSEISRCRLEVSAMFSLEQDRVNETIPTVRLDQYRIFEPTIVNLFPTTNPIISDLIHFTAEGLKVAWTPDMPLSDYLDVVVRYRGSLRGTLPFVSDPTQGVSAALDTVSSLNREIEEISQSRRYRWGNIPISIARTTPQMISLLMRVMIGHQADKIFDAISKSLSSKPETRVREGSQVATATERTMAALFGKDIPIIQLWGLRKSLSRTNARAKRANIS